MKIVCEVCQKEGYLQHIGQNYCRVRHYVGSVDEKPKFEYHKQSPGYIEGISKQSGANGNIDLNLNNIGSFNQTDGRGSLAWLGRQTHNLENNGAKCA